MKKFSEKVYYLPLQEPKLEHLEFAGFYKKTSLDISRSLFKARSGEYKKILIDKVESAPDLLSESIQMIREAGFEYIVRYQDLNIREDDLRHPEVQIVFSSAESFAWEKVKIISANVKISLLYRPQKNLKDVIRDWVSFPKWARPIVYLDCLPVGGLTAGELFQLCRCVREEWGEHSVRPFPHLDHFDHRIPLDMDLEPYGATQVLQRISKNPVKLSVIIPTFNNYPQLQNTLHFLSQQEYRDFEVIVVDDGSTDGTFEKTSLWLKAHMDCVDHSLIFFPRVVSRKPGDFRFRAGISRNLGVKFARGESLLFLDSDIILPPQALKNIDNELKDYDLVQIQRRHLCRFLAHENVHFHPDFISKHSSFRYHPAGEKFKSVRGQGWNDLDAKWAHVGTYGLAMRTKAFKQVGWFRKIFCHYGFEDVDLGYRFNLVGAKFFLSSVIAYHQFSSPERHEFSYNEYKKFKMLSTSAKIFYSHYLDPQIFERFRLLMGR